MKHVNYFIFSVLTLCSCMKNPKEKSLFSEDLQSQTVSTGKALTIPILNLKKYNSISLSGNQVDSLSYVELEMTDKSMIGSITQLEFFDNMFFVLDADKAQALFVFDSHGKYLWKIQRIGNGPGEYSTLKNFSINHLSKQIHLLSLNPKMKVIVFDNSGKFLEEKKLPFFTRSFTLLSDETYLFDNGYCNNKNRLKQEKNLIRTDLNMKVLNVYYPYNSDLFNRYSSIYSNFYNYNKQNFYIDDLKASLCSIEAGQLNLKYQFDFGDHSMDLNKLNLSEDDFRKYIKESDIYHLVGAYETGSHLSFQIFTSKNVYFGFFSKKTHQLTIGNQANMSLESTVSPNIVGSLGNRFISVLNPSLIYSMKEAWCSLSNEKKKLTKLNKDWQVVLENYREDSNPVLAIFFLK